MRIFITGGAGFVGSHLINRLRNTFEILSIDNFNSYYDVSLKKDRVSSFGIGKLVKEIDICDESKLEEILRNFQPDLVVHLAAQAGVRFSLSNPNEYINSNILGFMNLLQAMRKLDMNQLLYASSSSVYGASNEMPYKESNLLTKPQSYYALTKIHNEQTARLFNKLYGLNSIGLRFFTVYGILGRPDMAYYDFSRKIKSGKKISVFSKGRLLRDYTYIDDICEMIEKIIRKCYPMKGVDILNLGNGKPRTINELVNQIEQSLDKKASINFEPFQAGDVEATYSDTSKLRNLINFSAQNDLEQGIPIFIDWLKNYEK